MLEGCLFYMLFFYLHVAQHYVLLNATPGWLGVTYKPKQHVVSLRRISTLMSSNAYQILIFLQKHVIFTLFNIYGEKQAIKLMWLFLLMAYDNQNMLKVEDDIGRYGIIKRLLVLKWCYSLELEHLVLHESDERTDNNADANTVHWGKLEAQAFPIPFRET